MVVETVKQDKHTRKRKNKQYKKIYLHDYDEIVDVDATFGERWQSWKLIFICTRRCSDIDKLSKRKTLDDFLWRWAFCPSALGRQGSHLQKKLHGTPGNCGDDNDGDGGDVDADGDGEEFEDDDGEQGKVDKRALAKFTLCAIRSMAGFTREILTF